MLGSKIWLRECRWDPRTAMWRGFGCDCVPNSFGPWIVKNSIVSQESVVNLTFFLKLKIHLDVFYSELRIVEVGLSVWK